MREKLGRRPGRAKRKFRDDMTGLRDIPVVMPAIPPKPKKKPAKRAPRGLSREQAHDLMARLAQDRPDPKTELDYTNPYTLLVAVALSAQATDVGVNKATRLLFQEADTPEKMVALGEDHVRDRIKTIGLFRNKAKNVIALSELLIARHGGEVPADRDALEALPGVGRKTANVVMNEAFGVPTIAVDTHIFRVSNRTRLAPGKDPLAVELRLEKIMPDEFRQGAHHWLILHGRYLCKARKPECWRCPVEDICQFKDKTPAPKGA
jgi:endonuclease-3